MTDESATLKLLKELIAKRSITPDDAGCQKTIAKRLKKIGFAITPLRFNDVDNLWAQYGDEHPLIVFAGHTDVVPAGPIEKWQSNPFHPEIRNGNFYGRGAADMKSGLAAMVTATEIFLQDNPKIKGSIAFLITSNEEGASTDGTQKVVELLQQQQKKIDWCIVGEASSEKKLGDTIKIGRRGSLHGQLTVIGKQGHIAYPNLADNPIHRVGSVIAELNNTVWDNGNDQFPPTSFQISNIHAGTGADNVIPGQLEMIFNFRFSTAVTPEELQQRVTQILDQHKFNYKLEWKITGKPFVSKHGELLSAASKAIEKIAGVKPQLSTSGGTSDGRFIANICPQVIELGPINQSIHQVNEHINITDLEKLTLIYQNILEQLFLKLT